MVESGNGLPMISYTKDDGLTGITVRRSDDTVVPFKPEWIVSSLKKETMLAESLFNRPRIKPRTAREIANSVGRKLEGIYPNGSIIPSRLVREMVCAEFMERGKNDEIYLIYNKIYSRVGVPFYEVWNEIWQYKQFEQNENANLNNGNPENIHKKLADQVVKEAMPIAFPMGIEKAHFSGDIHVHQMEYPQRPFCADYDLRYFFLNGLLADGTGYYSSATIAAKNAAVAILHAVKVLAAGQCNCQGGQGLFNFNIFIAPYLEKMPYDKESAGNWQPGSKPMTIKQCAQMFIYEMNLTYVSRGGQLVFSSIQIEPTIPNIWKDKPVIYKGKKNDDLVYGDFEEESQLFAIALLETYLEGDRFGKMFFFPKPEVKLRKEHFTKPDPRTKKILELSVELSAKFGSTYFDSVIPEYRDSEGQDCYQCCAYHFSEDADTLEPKLWYEDGQHFSMSGQQVVTINLPRLAYRSKGDPDIYYELLEEQMDNARRFLIWKRDNVLDFAKRGNLPFLTQRPLDNPTHPPLYDIESSSLVIGFVGMNETVHSLTGLQLHEGNPAIRQGLRILAEMERIRKDFVKHTGLSFAIARTPAESTAQTFAVKDLLKFNGQASAYVHGNVKNWKKAYKENGKNGVPVYYTNGFMVNHGASVDIPTKLSIEEKPFPLLSGGNICNIFLGEKYPDCDALFGLIKQIAMETQIGYFSITRDLTLCRVCFYSAGGLQSNCKQCGSANVSQYSRITGYYGEVGGWNSAKEQELKDRHREDI